MSYCSRGHLLPLQLRQGAESTQSARAAFRLQLVGRCTPAPGTWVDDRSPGKPSH